MSSRSDPATGTQRRAGALVGAALIGMLLACSPGGDGEAKPAAADAEEAAVVHCEIKGSVSFMSRGDCLSRKGRPF